MTLSKRRARTRMKSDKYVTKESLQRELVILHTQNRMTDDLHLMFFDMAKRIAKKGCFVGYSDVEDMVMDAYMKCINNAHKYDVEKSNPFAYFTTVIFNVFIESIKATHRFSDIKKQELDNWHQKMQDDFDINVPKVDHVTRR